MKALRVAILACCVCFPQLAQNAFAGQATNEIRIVSATVDGSLKPIRHDKSVSLGSSPKNILFDFEHGTNPASAPFRMRYRLEGYENNWNEGGAWMSLAVRFYANSGDQVGQTIYKVVGDSAGWNGSLKSSPLAHRRETLIVPPSAHRVWVVIASAGPPDTVGIYVVANLVLTESTNSSRPVTLIQSPFDRQLDEEINDLNTPGWTRDGISPTMAKIIKYGQFPEQKAFALEDDSLTSHAEWHTIRDLAPVVSPGGQLVIEWNEMYSIGIGGMRAAGYPSLPTGTYHFHVIGLNLMGIPTGAEDSIEVVVPQPFFKTSWFWSGLLITIVMIVGGSWRYISLQRMRREMLYLKKEQTLERERLRIAHDIHDDLGARMTQICLLSATCQADGEFSEKARTNFEQISRMSRELVTALYQTVWAVNPENDNLDALGNYICQMVKQLCDQAHIRCRFYWPDLPLEIQVSSQTRHNIIMVVKEAVHNVIKHAKATEININVEFVNGILSISVQDDGCGFELAGSVSGNGLANMQRRLNDLNGSFSVKSEPGRGTTVRFSVAITPHEKQANESDAPYKSR